MTPTDVAALPPPSVSLQDIIVTQDLDRRADGPTIDPEQVKRAILELATRMVDGPEEVLPRFVDLAIELAAGIASGISVFESDASPQVFRWAFLRGSLSAFEGVTTPRDFSPCGVTLDCNAPVLARHAERYYSWISDAGIVVPEVLLVPLHRGQEQLGTLWIVSDTVGHFSRSHAGAMTELAAFVSIALQMLQTERRLKAALAEQEALAKEMSHRVKNVFNIVDGMIHLSVRGATSKEDLATALRGRVSALAAAHAIVRRSFSDGSPAAESADLRALIAALLKPHEAPFFSRTRFVLDGPEIPLGEHAANTLALMIHELATNAAKYGALSIDGGCVEVRWKTEDDALAMEWRERGGPPIAGKPLALGFGSKLLLNSGQGIGGIVAHDWAPSGLVVALRLPICNLKA